MKLALRLALVLVVVGQTFPAAQGPSGDFAFWIPYPNSEKSSRQAQIERNSQYVSVRLNGLYAYYRGGFFGNVKTIAVKSGVALDNPRVEGEMVNAVWPKSRNAGDFIALHDHLLMLSPASPQRIELKVSLGAIGEDQFKRIFDTLSGADLKVPLQLTDAALGKVNAITSIVRRFFATPYTAASPANMLQVSQSFILYSDRDADRVDALREGYFVVVSGRDGKSSDLSRLLDLRARDPFSIRVGPDGQDLLFRDGATWRRFEANSYAIFAVTQSEVRGEDEAAVWFQKYLTAREKCREVITGTSAETVWKQATELWAQGNVLLAADRNYLESERHRIRSKHYAAIEREIKSSIEKASNKPIDAIVLDATQAPEGYLASAEAYDRALEAASSTVTVEFPHVMWRGGKVVAVGWQDSATTTVDETGKATLTLKPGTYVIQASGSGTSTAGASTTVSVSAGEEMKIAFPAEAGAAAAGP